MQRPIDGGSQYGSGRVCSAQQIQLDEGDWTFAPLVTHREPHLSVLVHVSHAPVDNDAPGTQVLGSSRHEAAPARGREAFGLLYVHDCTSLIVVDKVRIGLGGQPVAALDHLDRDGGTHDPAAGGRGEGPDAVQEAPARYLELH